MINALMIGPSGRRWVRFEGARLYLPGFEWAPLYALYLPNSGQWMIVDERVGYRLGEKDYSTLEDAEAAACELLSGISQPEYEMELEHARRVIGR